MDEFRERIFNLCTESKSELVLFEGLKQITSELGFEHCSYGMRIPIPVTDPGFYLLSDFPKGWEEKYVSNNYFAIDPTVQHGLRNSTPLIWSATNPIGRPEFWEEAQQAGLCNGWSMPVHGGFGSIGLLSLMRSADRLSEKEMLSNEEKMMWVAMNVHSTMANLITPKWVPEATQELTSREQEVLKWTAIGKTYSEIGCVLSIDARTVKFHLVNTMRKLNAANKTEAAVKAYILGLLN
ncbi:LuxR family transcriptional regulator [Pseudomonas sp. MWU13-2100]|uniref:LuxR family transcriptional regulator n=1 Tax=Pseudomonas sp. MWU13-2100 TaxID=2935075 RepID=UPI00200E6841|nr:LuxR family transcriptional regulator [Pseudomonas sp. MWU13-2100]